MILKTKSLQTTSTPRAIAGQKQEQDVAFFLRRAFKDNPEVLVINDFKFSFNDETAQIDHLIVYTYGFVLIESKSIKIMKFPLASFQLRPIMRAMPRGAAVRVLRVS